MSNACRRVIDHPWFRLGVILLIVANTILVGVETSRPLTAAYPQIFHLVDRVILTLFVIELALRFGATWRRPGAFFRDPWNVFDAVIVAASLLPAVGSFATVARVARVLRVTRLVSVSRNLRLIIGTMLKSIPSLGHVALLLGLLLYVYAVLGVNLFADADGENWGSLGTALLTLFQMLTLEGWVEMQDQVIGTHRWAWIYFASFVVVAVFVVVNLFIAVVLNNLEEVKAEQHRDAEALKAAPHTEPASAGAGMLVHLQALRRELEALERSYAEALRSLGSSDHRASRPRTES